MYHESKHVCGTPVIRFDDSSEPSLPVCIAHACHPSEMKGRG